jgi:flagella basal body P-ring formation protein FlgA
MMHGRMQILKTAWMVVALAAGTALRADDGVQVELQPEAQVADRMVHVADVARISGGTSVQRDRIGSLDLVEITEEQSKVEVTRGLVVARLLLGGESPASFEVTGETAVLVSRQLAQGAGPRAIEAARKSIAQHLSLSTADVVVQLSQPLPADVTRLIDGTEAGELTARTSNGPGGRTRVDLWLSDGKGGQTVRPIAVDVRFRQLAPVAARKLAARQKLTAEDITLEIRELPQRGVTLTLEQLAGRTLRNPVAAGEIVMERDLVVVVDETSPVLIKPRDIVRVTAKKRNLTLTLPAAEAIESGRLGESIRLRNPTSTKIITGRVTGRGEVEVPL